MPAFIECDLMVMLCSLPLVCKASIRTECTMEFAGERAWGSVNSERERETHGACTTLHTSRDPVFA